MSELRSAKGKKKRKPLVFESVYAEEFDDLLIEPLNEYLIKINFFGRRK